MKIIYTRKQEEILVDDDWYEMLNYVPWQIAGGYAVSSNSFKIIKRCFLDRMHRLILNAPVVNAKTTPVDHINGNKLDNRRSNLRICSHGDNMRNSKTNSKNTSGYRGVHFDKKESMWKSQIKNNSKQKTIGLFSCKEIAAWAWNKEASKLNPETSVFNKIVVDGEEIFKL